MPASAYSDWLSKTMSPETVSVGVAYMMSEECKINGEMFHMAGGRISRLRLAESEGILGAGDAIEDVRAAMPRVMADADFFYPQNLIERSLKVARQFGFQGGMDADAYAVTPIGKG